MAYIYNGGTNYTFPYCVTTDVSTTTNNESTVYVYSDGSWVRWYGAPRGRDEVCPLCCGELLNVAVEVVGPDILVKRCRECGSFQVEAVIGECDPTHEVRPPWECPGCGRRMGDLGGGCWMCRSCEGYAVELEI